MTPNLHRFTARKKLVFTICGENIVAKCAPGRRTMKLMDERSDTNWLINSQPLCTARNCNQCLVAENVRTFHLSQSYPRHNIAVLAHNILLCSGLFYKISEQFARDV